MALPHFGCTGRILCDRLIWRLPIVVAMLPHIVLAWEFMATDAVHLSAYTKGAAEA